MNEGIINTKRHSRVISGLFFKNDNDKKKFSKGVFKRDIEISHLSGALTVLANLLNKNVTEPYASVDELLGDMHILFRDVFNENAKLSKGAVGPIDLEQVLIEAGCIK